MKTIIGLILATVLAVVVGNYYLWHSAGEEIEPTEQEYTKDSADPILLEDKYSVEKLNSQVSVQQLRKLVLKDEQETLVESSDLQQDSQDYDLNQLDEDISSLQQYLNKE
ncbi:hypothetical protein Q4491_08140 [Photobacterium sp. 2_MG-2023]|uniref:hypothetical protein n=1 Tax=Photobacterium sp. 2_MG-2023 TaxID=3062663 RepID=UPI0026E41C81|nr:hypothetical protein [Photobacterium sp. 2_MG-2023]MDO6581316.1 hypothetical protein [Photobacterium sp. 2_MG-2023]